MRADTPRTSSSARSAEPRTLAGRGLPRTISTVFEDPASTRLGQFFGPAADEHPGLSGFSLLSHGREAFIVRLALADLAERSLDMQYYIWDGDTTGRIIVERVMKAADRGVRVRLLVDDPYYKASDSVKAALDAHPNVEICLFNPLTNRRWSAFDFIFDFGRVNRRMHNKLMVSDNAAAIVGGRNIGDIYYGVNTIANYRDLDVLAVGPVVRDLSGVFDRYWNSPSTVPIAAIVDRAHGPADLDAILICLREAIAAVDYPYPIDQDLDELAAQGTELRDNLVWARGRVIADDPETIARAKESDHVVEFIRGRVAQLKKELLVEFAVFCPTRRSPGNRQGAARTQCPGTRADQLSRFERYAAGAFRLRQDPQAAARERDGAIRTTPGYRRVPDGLVAAFWAVVSDLAYQGHGVRRRSRVRRKFQPRPALCRDQHRSRPLHREPGACRKANGLHGDWRRARQQLPRPPRSEWRDRLGDGKKRPKGALPGRARNWLPPALRRRPVEAPTDRLATLTPDRGPGGE